MSELKKKGLVPELRFPEFRDESEWTEKSLNIITSSIFDGTHQTPKYTEEGIPFFSVENIVSGKSNKFISKKDYMLATSKNKPEKNDVLITRIGNIGFSTVVDWSYEFSIYVTLAVVKSDDRFNSRYLNSYMQSGRYQREIQSKSLLNAVPCKINMDELRKTKVLLPELNEQQKIADCLTSIDELITAHTHKLDALKRYKKGLMQQLFPAEGETEPKLRFPEFRGNWEECRLESLVDLLSGFAFKSECFSREGRKLVTPKNFTKSGYGSFDQDNTKCTKENVDSKYICSEGDLLLLLTDLTPSCELLGKPLLLRKDDGKVLLNQRIVRVIPAESIHNRFLLYFFLTDRYHKRIKDTATGSTVRHSSSKLVLSSIIQYPSLEEQQRIIHLLSAIDEVVSRRTQEIETLKKHKKGLMQKLFPNTGDY